MKKNLLLILALVGTLGIASPLTVFASNGNQKLTVSDSISQSAFEEMINEIETIKSENPGLSEDEILELMDNRHSSSLEERGIIDIWNALTDSEKTLCIRYPFDALKVNTARNIATEQTERKFGCNGLGDRSDAFRHGIWNAEMTVLIGSEKAELFATAHEDKDVTGNESDGYPKTAHRDMDLHNNEVGRAIGEENSERSEDEMADIIYQDICSEETQFIWLHD
ncbi:hypothetical protein DWZ44_04150 [Blautia sp. AF32-4BH]|jgi:hypothetical protein|uniref:DUF6973 domain-containing protein n=1 Tax=Lachnospiraceae TaxID=186803 RepID=UPI000E5373AD|nr:hypothetical protein [Blautia sp. AF32-4BH]RGF68823.1 hypothetical protein DWZ44_04150 [Blautia sp. AF32-4BH]RGI25327.1 hypothetical protein DXC15_14320 [Ruminococcus sp. OM08-13AT]RGI54486.1 hypothetical protein DXA86_13930 [Ruminococcus sp. OF05-2BH]RHU90175.1 hypothetical protein DXC27_02955 [Ruminococcus sp. OM08-7]